MDKDLAKVLLGFRIARKQNISFYAARDVIDHIQEEINNVLYGESEYNNCLQVLKEYGLSKNLLFIFLDIEKE